METARPVAAAFTSSLGLQRLRQEDGHEYKAILGYVAVTRTIQQTCLRSQANGKQGEGPKVMFVRCHGCRPLFTGGATSASERAPGQLRGGRQPFTVEDVKTTKEIPHIQGSFWLRSEQDPLAGLSGHKMTNSR